MVAYGQRLKKDPVWALEEGGKFFSDKSDVNTALVRITKHLDELAIPYAVVGGMALFQYGYRRFTEDVDLLVTSEGLRAIHSSLEGKGYLPKFAGSRNLRDTESGVSIKFLVTGEYPGDRKEKPIKFPEPDGAATFVGSIRCLNLAALIELKLASGITSPGRLKDLADIQQLIQVLRLPSSYADQLDEYVKAKFKELVGTDTPARRFIRLWPGDVQHENLETDLQVMLADGVALEVSPDPNEPSWLVTQDPTIAQKYDMHDEIEFMK